MESLISIQRLAKEYPTATGVFMALSDVSLDIAPGEFISILGPSGCGKSTLLNCIAGLESYTEGVLTLKGTPVKAPPGDTGLVFQRDVLLDWYTVLDNVLLPARIKHLDLGKWRDRARSLLATLGLEGVEDRFPWQLSGGMRQRVAICRGMLLDPTLLLMDEPFGALDALTRDELNLELSRIWNRTNKTIVFITHSIPEAVFLGTRVVVMDTRPGRIADVLEVRLPRERTLDLRETPEFTSMTRRIRSMFEDLGILRTRVA